MKKILLPTDFSACASNALDFAVQTAKMLSAELVVMHAFEDRGSTYSDYVGLDKGYKDFLFQEAGKKLREIQTSVEDAQKINVKTLINRGDVNKSILEAADENNADLIVMGTHGASGLKEKLWGSKTADIVGQSKIPVIVIPYGYQWQKPRNILLLTNRFEREPSVLDPLFEMAAVFMAGIQVVVFSDEDEGFATLMKYTHEIPEYEQLLKERYKDDKLKVTHLYGKNFEDTIQEFITKNEIDLFVMIAHKRTFLEKFVNPDTTKKFSYHARIPMLALHAEQE